MSKKTYTGINIQHPISQLIVEGKKIIETRTYNIPGKYLNQEMALVETPGKNGKFKARIIAIIKFTECFQYQTKKEFYADSDKHCVTPSSPWAWEEGEKWGWKVCVVEKLPNFKTITKKKGIKFTLGITL
ncbi:MAG: hypothetical protein HOP07_10365 [Bacteriovoracaceae bacterium]|nr:hypothetical protein [Bacteriovoracaceae bacterium]